MFASPVFWSSVISPAPWTPMPQQARLTLPAGAAANIRRGAMAEAAPAVRTVLRNERRGCENVGGAELDLVFMVEQLGNV